MHSFTGKWITDEEFYNLSPRNVFFQVKDVVELSCKEHRNCHILFRKEFYLGEKPGEAKIYITADDYYKLYINGSFVSQGPAPSYHFRYNYNVIDVTEYLAPGKNIIAVHTLYQGLINRVWQSGDNRHGLILDLEADGKNVLCSDESFKTARHSGYKEIGTVGYDTQFLEEYDSTALEVGFEHVSFDDKDWKYAKINTQADYSLIEQTSDMLVFEHIRPVEKRKQVDHWFFDFGSNYVGYLCIKVKGKKNDVVTVRCAQELNEDGSIRYKLRANCNYEETWILDDGESKLDWFDYKAFRYVELVTPDKCEILDVYFVARHYPFELNIRMKPEFAQNEKLQKIWELCVNSQRYGVQEVIQDCMEREKGFYLGDGCYTSLTYMLLSGDDTMVRKLIDDAFSSTFIADTMMVCLNGSYMQEMAEFSLMLTDLILWHYRITKDIEYLKINYPKITRVLEAFRRDYEESYLIRHTDMACLVEWPPNFRHGYDVDLPPGKGCYETHVSINAYYIGSIKSANEMARILNKEIYRDVNPCVEQFFEEFYNKELHLFKDSNTSEHISIVGNVFPFAFGLCPDEEYKENFVQMLRKRKISSLSLFCTFPALKGLIVNGWEDLIEEMLLDEDAWLRTIREGGTTTFEGWGKDSKWNTSLFHLTMSYAAAFLADVDLKECFRM